MGPTHDSPTSSQRVGSIYLFLRDLYGMVREGDNVTFGPYAGVIGTHYGTQRPIP
jgi:hypothetical protein